MQPCTSSKYSAPSFAPRDLCEQLFTVLSSLSLQGTSCSTCFNSLPVILPKHYLTTSVFTINIHLFCKQLQFFLVWIFYHSLLSFTYKVYFMSFHDVNHIIAYICFSTMKYLSLSSSLPLLHHNFSLLWVHDPMV